MKRPDLTAAFILSFVFSDKESLKNWDMLPMMFRDSLPAAVSPVIGSSIEVT